MPAENALNSSKASYRLLDFGEGRKLEDFGGLILDRPSPAADGDEYQRPDLWDLAHFRFRIGVDDAWSANRSAAMPEPWLFVLESLQLELRLAPFGHVGVFPEQVSNWRWLQACIREASRPVKALNLFGYTGGSTLAMAAAGASVTHVDASRPTVQWAKNNAAHSGMTESSVRWLVDDVRRFVDREKRRGNLYDVIVMDPPAYGHGVNGDDWQIERDLGALLQSCLQILTPQPVTLLLTGHSPIPSIELGPISDKAWRALESRFENVGKHRVGLLDSTRRKLDFGYAYRFF